MPINLFRISRNLSAVFSKMPDIIFSVMQKPFKKCGFFLWGLVDFYVSEKKLIRCFRKKRQLSKRKRDSFDQNMLEHLAQNDPKIIAHKNEVYSDFWNIFGSNVRTYSGQIPIRIVSIPPWRIKSSANFIVIQHDPLINGALIFFRLICSVFQD